MPAIVARGPKSSSASSEAPLAACPQCGGEVKKLISSPAFQFKGTGWYVTDYAGKKGGGRTSPEKSEGKSEGQSEGKPDEGRARGRPERVEGLEGIERRVRAAARSRAGP